VVQPLQRGRHLREGFQLLDLADQIFHLVPAVFDAGAVHDMGDRAMPDLAIGRVLAMQQRVDHRVLEMGAPPPGDERIGIAAPALGLQERRGNRHKSPLHVDHRAVLVEHADLDGVPDVLLAHGDDPP